MAQSWLRKLMNRLTSSARPARGTSPRRKGRWGAPVIEQLEDRTLLSAPANTGQIFDLGSFNNPPPSTLYLRQDAGDLVVSTDNTNWLTLLTITGAGAGTG